MFDHVKPNMQVYQQEIFGPVLCVVRVASLKEAVELINQNIYGNGGAIITNDGRAAQYFSEYVHVGMVGINVPIPVPSAYHSFGGWKQSSFGDVGMHGDQSVQFYTRRKSIAVRWALPKGAELAMTSHQL